MSDKKGKVIQGWIDSVVGSAFVLHMANPYLFPSIPYSYPNMTMINLWVKFNKKALSIVIGTAIILYSVLGKIVILTILIL